MILSARERRILAEIERRLADTDPRFVKAMCRDTSDATEWRRTGCAAITVLAGLSALLCAALLLIGPALLAALLATHYPRQTPPTRDCHAHPTTTGEDLHGRSPASHNPRQPTTAGEERVCFLAGPRLHRETAKETAW